MEQSGELHLIVCLDAYVGPAAVVDDFVRKQLTSEEQMELIQDAIHNRIDNLADIPGLYSFLLSCSGLDFEKKSRAVLSIIEQGILQRALFDLMTFHRVKWSQLLCYSHVHEFRTIIQEFLLEYRNLGLLERVNLNKLWWDSQEPVPTTPKPWVSPELYQDPDFALVLQSWLSDGQELQRWLDEFAAKTTTVNNPKYQNRVFSHTIATKAIEFAKVRCLMKYCPININ